MFTIPGQSGVKTDLETDVSQRANIFETKNMDFSQTGYAKVSPSLYTFDEFISGNQLGVASAITYYNDKYYAVTDRSLVYFSNIGDAVTEDLTTNRPITADNSDAVLWEGRMYVTETDDLHYLDGSTWTSGVKSLNSGAPHPMCVIPYTNVLVVGNGSGCKSIDDDGSHTTLFDLTLPEEYTVLSVAAVRNTVYIGTAAEGGVKAKLFLWDNSDAVADNAYEVNADAILSVTPYNGGVALITSAGELLTFNGGSFKRLGVLPIYNSDSLWMDGRNMSGVVSGSQAIVPVRHRGMVAKGDDIYINLDNGVSGAVITPAYVAYQHFGVWKYQPDIGLYHHLSPRGSKIESDTILTSDVNTTDDEITVTTAPETGTMCVYDDASGTAITGLTDNEEYYVIKVDDTTIQLATTVANAEAGTAVSLTGTGNSSQTLTFYTAYDAGQIFSNRAVSGFSGPGALYFDPNGQSTTTKAGRTLLVGNAVAQKGTTAKDVISAISDLPNVGWMSTQWIETSQVTDGWNSVSIFFKKLQYERDKIIVKYRTERKPEYDEWLKGGSERDDVAYFPVTWTSQTTFTTNDTIFDSAVVGEEVTFTMGAGSGRTEHISSVSESGGTYTVTLKDSVPNVRNTNTARGIIQNWRRLGEVNGLYNGEYKTFTIGKQSPNLQIKIELQGVDTSLRKVKVDDKIIVKV